MNGIHVQEIDLRPAPIVEVLIGIQQEKIRLVRRWEND